MSGPVTRTPPETRAIGVGIREVRDVDDRLRPRSGIRGADHAGEHDRPYPEVAVDGCGTRHLYGQRGTEQTERDGNCDGCRNSPSVTDRCGEQRNANRSDAEREHQRGGD
jgi:hypothetical protein